MFSRELELWGKGLRLVAGLDEAGRGPLAGPVVAACVVFPPGVTPEGLADSKALSARRREELLGVVLRMALEVGVGMATSLEIDRLNILAATHLAMRRALGSLAIPPEVVLVDGLRADLGDVEQVPIVGGDSSCGSIAAASILAKVTRDRYMASLSILFPGYGLERNKGYGTREHLAALSDLGPSCVHRRSFAPVSAPLLPGMR